MSAPPSDSTAQIQIDVNGENHGFPGPCSIAQMLSQLSLGGKRVAVAVNRKVIVRARYAEVVLADGDRVEILEAVGGG